MQRRTSVLIVLVVLAAAAGAALWWLWPVRVEVASVSRGPAIEAVYATGVVEPSVMVPVAPRAGGRLAAIEVEEGAQVKRGQVLARIESADLEQTVQEMQARERLARLQFERTRELVAQKFVSGAELDRTRTELAAAQAALRRAQAQRNYNQLVAPQAGIVIKRDGELGQFVAAGQAVLTLACCEPLRVTAEVDEEDISRVSIGQKVVMRSDALPKQLFDGEVAEITPKGDPSSRSYRVRIRFAQQQPIDGSTVRSGMTMDANLIVSRREDALLVPNRALAGDVVWVLESGQLQRREVRRGVAGTERTEIIQGLKADEVVVLNPAATLRAGQRVRAAASPASAAASAAP